MEEIELSVMSYDYALSDLQTLLSEFEAQHHVHVKIQSLSWETSWTEIMKFAMYGHGPVVSEVGSTWVGSLAQMNVLRPFTQAELKALGGSTTFLAAAWDGGRLRGDENLWAVPWLAEMRAIFYRRDLLLASGVDETTAFGTQARLEHTLDCLRAGGVAIPWAVPTQPTLNTVHNITSWVWGAGGDFLDEEHQRVTFAEGPARVGLRDYFGLYRFLPPEARHLDPTQAENLFVEGHAAATMSGPWLLMAPYTLPITDLPERVGVALPPGVPCVSASHLVIWEYIEPRQEKLALELVQFLTSHAVQFKAGPQVGLLPVRHDILADPLFSAHPIYHTLAHGLTTGRSFPSLRLWGLIEDKLSAALGNVWARVLDTPGLDLDEVIQSELEPLAHRLNVALQ